MANEKRLISAKELERKVKAAFQDTPYLMGQMLRWIRKQTTVDAVEVVRCGECKYLTADGLCWEKIRGSVGYKEISLDDFCSYGERKDNGT